MRKDSLRACAAGLLWFIVQCQLCLLPCLLHCLLMLTFFVFAINPFDINELKEMFNKIVSTECPSLQCVAVECLTCTVFVHTHHLRWKPQRCCSLTTGKTEDAKPLKKHYRPLAERVAPARTLPGDGDLPPAAADRVSWLRLTFVGPGQEDK